MQYYFRAHTHSHHTQSRISHEHTVIGFYFLPLSDVPMNHKRQTEG